MVCFLVVKEMGMKPRRMQYPVVDLQSSRSPAQSKSQKVVKVKLLGVIWIPYEDVSST